MLTILRYLAVQLYHYATIFIQTIIRRHQQNDQSLAVKLKLTKCHNIDIVIQLATIQRRMNPPDQLVLLPTEEQVVSNQASTGIHQSAQPTTNVMFDTPLGTPWNRPQLFSSASTISHTQF